MTSEQFAEWLKERNEAVASLDLKTFKAFYRKWQKAGVYTKALPTDKAVELAMYMMAVEIISLPAEVREKAKQRLLERGYYGGISDDRAR